MVMSIQFQRVTSLGLMVAFSACGFAALAGEADPPMPARVKPRIRTDQYGDPLPPGALARLGTVRLRPGNSVRFLACLPDRKNFLSVAEEEETMLVSVWRLTTGELLRRFTAPMRILQAVDLASDGKTLVTSGYDRVDGAYHVLFWSIVSGRRTAELKETNGRVLALAFTPDGKALATAGEDQIVRLWDAATQTELRRLEDVKDKWWRLVFSSDGKSLAAIGQRHTVQVWNVATGKLRNSVDLGPGAERDVAFSSELKTLVTSGNDGKKLQVWDLAHGKKLREIAASAGATAIALAPDGKSLAWGEARQESKLLTPRAIHLCDLATGSERHRLRGHLFGVDKLAFSADCKRLISAGGGSAMDIWDVATGGEVAPFQEHESYVRAVGFSPDGRSLITGGLDGAIRLWEPGSGKPARLFEEGHRQRVWNVAFGMNAQQIISYGHDGFVRYWDATTGRQTRQLDVSGDRNSIPFHSSPDGRTIALWPKNAPIRLIDAATGAELRRLRSTAETGIIRFSPDGKKLASISISSTDHSGVVQVWETETGKELRMWRVSQAGQIAFSPDGQALFSVSSEFLAPGMNQRIVHEWDTLTGESRIFPIVQKSRLFSLAVSPDGRMLAWGDAVGTITLWEVAARQVRRGLKGHHSYVESLAFSPDGKTLASGSADTTAMLWDVTGMPFDPPSFPLGNERLRSLWDDLANKDAGKAFDAIGLLSASAEQAVPLLKSKLRAAPKPADREHVIRLITELDSDDFAIREKAMEQLRQLGERAQPGLREALKDKLPLEARKRIEELLEAVRMAAISPEYLRNLRAIEVLEHIGTSEARGVLKTLADGPLTARLTREAKVSLERLARRRSLKP